MMLGQKGERKRMGVSAAIIALAFGAVSSTARAEVPVGRVSVASPLLAVDDDGQTLVTRLALDGPAYQIVKAEKRIRMTDFVVGTGERVELDLEQVEVFADNARIVLATPRGDVALPEPDVVLLSGKVVGRPRSSAFLAISRHGSHGIIKLADQTVVVSSGPHGGDAAPVVYTLEALPPGAITWRAFKCGTDDLPLAPGAGPADPAGVSPNGARSASPPRRVLIAVETDWQFVNTRFGQDYDAATAYVALLIGAVSEIYTRDFNVRLQISYLRLWPDSNDPWDQPDTGGQLTQFRNYWNANMGGVERHLAHFLSGRFLGGGMAYLPALCNTPWGYGVSQVNGFFPYPLQHNHSQNWDPFVVSHELGHNFGAPHTHSMIPPIDGCGLTPQDCSVTPNGTIMSYCHGCSGGQTNIRLEFHDRMIDERVLPYLGGVSCNLTQAPALPQQAPYPHNRRKNRYISFDPNRPEFADVNLAFKVELKQLTLGSCSGNGGFCGQINGSADCNTCSADGNACISRAIDCAPVPPQSCDSTGETCINDAPDVGGTSVGHTWWIGPESPLGNGVHLLVSESFRRVSTDWPNPTHVGDCEIVPRAVYGVRSVDADTGAESDELQIETTLYAPISSSYWGDAVGPLKKSCGGDISNPVCAGDADCTAPQTCDRAWTLPDGSVNFDDIGAALALVAPGPTSVEAETTWVDLHGNGTGAPGSQHFDPPNLVLNFADVAQIISGFGGFPYKGYDPADCPDSGTWP